MRAMCVSLFEMNAKRNPVLRKITRSVGPRDTNFIGARACSFGGRRCKESELAEPLRIVDGAVEVVGGLVAFELAFASGLLCFGKKSGGLSGS